ncbi:hypothetical protein BLA24_14275 [Streptomyces cinnamoneus]|uniref:DUF397 domain-containing protein n=1 Tax=Streptomyces cinnamoneus TaxID=53446 RepID=A0A2G1XIB1_STRCJ|nr:DUF397 domain-containing protein [Streptomyces cinnamoneus]PHQ50957.1 hypothetical protein BLA24_14275 [Streptomyces cinnamoneus]PPT13821.1 DUF397 domain-containing protein [Streptomyces cinnamoneus]
MSDELTSGGYGTDVRAWQRSSFCAGGGNNCVELARPAAGPLHLRESEAPGTVIQTNPTALGALIASLKQQRG